MSLLSEITGHRLPNAPDVLMVTESIFIIHKLGHIIFQRPNDMLTLKGKSHFPDAIQVLAPLSLDTTLARQALGITPESLAPCWHLRKAIHGTHAFCSLPTRQCVTHTLQYVLSEIIS